MATIKILIATILVMVSVVGTTQTRWQRFRAMHNAREGANAAPQMDPSQLPPNIKILRDLPYGADTHQAYDVYAPADARNAPVIFMVHGGGWRRGDKAAANVVQQKVSHWVPRGIVVVSINYPMLPGAPPLQQAQFVAKALARAQRDAAQWGGNPRKFVLMGHSAGAHLVSLISAEPSLATSRGALPWLGTVALDSAAYNVVTIMQARHLRLYDEAFGSDPAVWQAASPTLQVKAKIAPLLAVCSSQRADSCGQAKAFAARARRFGARIEVLPEDLRHGVINQALGQPSAYTSAVDGFLANLDPTLASRLH